MSLYNISIIFCLRMVRLMSWGHISLSHHWLICSYIAHHPQGELIMSRYIHSRINQSSGQVSWYLPLNTTVTVKSVCEFWAYCLPAGSPLEPIAVCCCSMGPYWQACMVLCILAPLVTLSTAKLRIRCKF